MMENEKNVKNKKMLIAILILLGIVLIGGSYAFLQAIIDSNKTSSINLTAEDLDNLQFSVNNDMSISITQFNFASGSPDKTTSTTGTASLRVTAPNVTPRYTYNVYLDIIDNNFVYSSGTTPELILIVTKPDGSTLTSIPGLTYNSTLQAFDITTQRGLIHLTDYEISATNAAETIQNWNFQIKFRNLDINQSANAGKTLNAKVIIQEDEIKRSFSDYCNDGDVFTDCIINYYASIDNIIYHSKTGAQHGTDTIANANLGAQDESYRFSGSGSKAKNYVVFGTDDATLKSNDWYQIVGAFKNESGDYELKLVKDNFGIYSELGTNGNYTGSGFYNFNDNTTSANNLWSESNLNLVNLNTNYVNYINGLDSKWKNFIVDHKWIASGVDAASVAGYNAYNMYVNEIKNADSTYSYQAKIGMLYASDYMYAASPTYWSYPAYDVNEQDYRLTPNYNYLYHGYYYWTITRSGATTTVAVNRSGYLENSDITSANSHFAYPAFYLRADTLYASGDGTTTNPFRIK